MSAITMVLLGPGGASGVAGGVVPSPTPAWTQIYGADTASSSSATIAGITSPISITGALSGGGALYYNLNGALKAYTGAFTANAGDTLGWTIVNITGSPVSGNLTVTNVSDASTVLATIPYSVSYVTL